MFYFDDRSYELIRFDADVVVCSPLLSDADCVVRDALGFPGFEAVFRDGFRSFASYDVGLILVHDLFFKIINQDWNITINFNLNSAFK